jgi:hypothetical protein
MSDRGTSTSLSDGGAPGTCSMNPTVLWVTSYRVSPGVRFKSRTSSRYSGLVTARGLMSR